MARKFLYLIALVIALFIAAGFIAVIWSREIAQLAFVPSRDYENLNTLSGNAYSDPAMWISAPITYRKGTSAGDPARWLPQNYSKTALDTSPSRPFAVFFIHPTSFLDRAHWNAPLQDEASRELADLYVKGMASPFNRAAEIWAPRYRQATIGAFLTQDTNAAKALNLAYQDIAQAYDFFIKHSDPKAPIILVGHSQGARHLLHLLKDKIASSEQRRRVAAIYAAGWPISVHHDLPSLKVPACQAQNQTGCLLSWVSFAEPANPGEMLGTYRNSVGFDGQLRANSALLCVNPLSGTAHATASKAMNIGTLVPNAQLNGGSLIASAVPARCDDSGLLLIGDPPEMGAAVLPGNNYHVYDIPLFWANLRQDAERRVNAWYE